MFTPTAQSRRICRPVCSRYTSIHFCGFYPRPICLKRCRSNFHLADACGHQPPSPTRRYIIAEDSRAGLILLIMSLRSLWFGGTIPMWVYGSPCYSVASHIARQVVHSRSIPFQITTRSSSKNCLLLSCHRISLSRGYFRGIRRVHGRFYSAAHR